MSNTILEMKNITKCFGKVKALDDVTFCINEGEIFALVGENGAGKSTLMKILSGSYSCDSYEGEIYTYGEKVNITSPKDSEDNGISMIYQEISMHLDISVAENILMGHLAQKRFGSVDWKTVNRLARKYLEMVQLDVDPSDTLCRLTTSQQQLVAIARALSKKPKVLVLDEPTSALTSRESDNLFKIIHDLKAKGITSILISHKLDEVFNNADRIGILRDGKYINTHHVSNTNREQVVSEMVGRTISTFYPQRKSNIGKEVLRAEGIVVANQFNSNKNIVDGVSFSLHKGEILGVAGIVGAGRSECMEAIFSKRKLKSGKVTVMGREVTIKTPQDAISHGIALVTEDRGTDGVIRILTIRENMILSSIKMICKLGIVNSKKEKKICDDFVKKLSIKCNSIETIVSNLSGGNQQKVILAKWLINNPRIIIMDEPTRGIDVGAKHEIYKLMNELVEKGVSIIMISSELPELISMSDRVIVLSNGRITAELNKSECTQETIIKYATMVN